MFKKFSYVKIVRVGQVSYTMEVKLVKLKYEKEELKENFIQIVE